jgi:DNA-binding MarR family transcriptional regulator
MTEHVQRGFKCDASWHLRESGLTLAIYTKIGAITYDGITSTYGTYFSSGRALAEFFGANEDSVTKILRELRKDGWLQSVGNEENPYKPNNYHFVTHDEWREKHSGQCYSRDVQVWDEDEHDLLAQSLHKISLGKTFWYNNMLAGLRATGSTDEEICGAWRKYFAQLEKKPKSQKGWQKIALSFVAGCKTALCSPI